MPDAPHHDEERPALELVPPPDPGTWRRERIGWVLLAILLVAALLGVFGGGPLSRTTTSAGAVRLEYDRFVRVSAPTVLEIVMHPGADQTETEVTLDHAYLDRVRLGEIVPQPTRAITRPDAIAFVFEAASAGAPVHVWFNLSVESAGLARGRLVVGGETIRFRQLAYP